MKTVKVDGGATVDIREKIKRVTITVIETVTYEFTAEIDEAEHMDEAYAEHLWLQEKAEDHLVSVDERELEWEVEGE